MWIIRHSLSAVALVCVLLLGALCCDPVPAQKGAFKRLLITQNIDEHVLVTLPGNTHPAARLANDQGPVADSLPLEHMYLQMKRAPELQLAADALIEQLHDPKSPAFHKWLTSDEIAERFGPAEQDVQAVSAWLTSHGFKVNFVYRANGVIDFSGPASAVREAFHTEIHNLSVNGKAHIANMSDPQIPAALAPAVHGVVSMHDFHPRPTVHPRPLYSLTSALVQFELIAPDDLYKIYNLTPLFAAGISGQGRTIVTVNDSDLYTTADWDAFRSTFHLAERFPHGSLTQIHPQPSANPNNDGSCVDPGVNPDGDDVEANLDAEWASATAPNATILAASCDNTNVQFGGYIAMQNLVTGPGPAPDVFTISYANSETQNGASANAYTYWLYEAAVLRGISVFNSAGDNGAAESDYYGVPAESGINVNALASTPRNVAVGGTDFADTYLGQNGLYWSTTNGPYFNSALSYVPEIPWNSSCASLLAANFLGFADTFGANGFCNSAFVGQNPLFLDDLSGGGGPSGCATGIPSIPSVVSGTCQGWRKPFYQYLVRGNPSDGVRDTPDVALFASGGFWSHYYVWCYSDPNGGVYASPPAPCVGPPSGWAGGGGTSNSTPVMAAIQALVNEATGGRQGNPNYVLYALAALQYDPPQGDSTCSATLGNQINSRCVFHDVTLGDIVVPCAPDVISGVTLGTFNCYIPSGTNGVLSLSNTSYEPMYPATPGWDFATGLGSVNAYNLVRAWPGSRLH